MFSEKNNYWSKILFFRELGRLIIAIQVYHEQKYVREENPDPITERQIIRR